jgi:hypothetical protein
MDKEILEVFIYEANRFGERRSVPELKEDWRWEHIPPIRPIGKIYQGKTQKPDISDRPVRYISNARSNFE